MLSKVRIYKCKVKKTSIRLPSSSIRRQSKPIFINLNNGPSPRRQSRNRHGLIPWHRPRHRHPSLLPRRQPRHQLHHQLDPSKSPRIRTQFTLPNLRAIAVQADISDPSGPKTLFDRAEQAFNSPVHVFVNSAGLINPKHMTISLTPVEDFDAMFDVNARGAFLCCQEAANRIVRGGGGRIVMITSSLTGALLPNVFGAYTASKAAVETMAKILAKELKGTKITVNCVAPGATVSEKFFEGKTEEDIKWVMDQNLMGGLGRLRIWCLQLGFFVGMKQSGLMGR